MTLVILLELIRTGSLAILGTLGQASIEGALVAGVVWAACRAVPALPAAVRTWLWWLVCLKLLMGVLPVPGVPLPWLPATAAIRTTPRQVATVPAAPVTFAASAQTLDAAPQTMSTPPAPAAPAPVSLPYTMFWPVLLLVAWLSLVALHAWGLIGALRNARHLRRHAVPAPAGLIHRAAQLVRLFALPVVPRVLASRLSAVPLITGVFRPAILLPAASTETFSRHELDLVLGHELAHVRRGDLVWGWVPAIASRLFFFHPLARLAVREYLAAREEACDAEVLQTLDAAPADYGQLLVKLGVATTDDVLAAAGSSPTFALLKRRLIMLDRSRTPTSRWWWALAGATAVLLPLTLVAQPMAPKAPTAPAAPARVAPIAAGSPDALPPVPPHPAPAPDAPPASLVDAEDVPPAPPPPPAPRVPPTPPALAVPAVPAAIAAPPAPPVAPEPPLPPVPPVQDEREGSRRIETPWVLVGPEDRNVMAASSEDRRAAERERRAPDDTLLWFRYQGTPYVTRDAATIKAVRDAYAPVNAVGEAMGRIGEKMGAQGGKQGAVGARQGELGAKQAALAAQMAKIAAEQASRVAAEMSRWQAEQAAAAAARSATTDAERQRVAQEREAVRSQREQLRTEQRAREEQLEVQMKALGDQQRALGEEMGAMGAILAEHGAELKAMSKRLEATLAEAQARVTSLLGSAVSSGEATRVK